VNQDFHGENMRHAACDGQTKAEARFPRMILAHGGHIAYQTRRMVRFHIFGIPVVVHPFFWITLALIGGGLNANSPSAILNVCLFLIAGFISVLLHELGHALTARKYGAHSEIVLQAFGGYAAYSGVRLTRPQSFLVTAAGPAVQILLGVLLFIIIPRLPEMSPYGRDFLSMLMGISIVWALLNLLPILPLDGGRMLDSILGPARAHITLWTTIIVASVIGIAALKFTGDFLLPVFMGMFAWQAWQALRENRWR
jgi:Zn-dependent protease